MASQGDQTILIINDNSDLSDLMGQILKKANYLIITAENGLDGLEIAQIENPDLIIIDVMMPVMDGIEFCRQARQLDQLKSTPIILVSAFYKGPESIVKGLEAGADSYIEMPCEPVYLVAKVSRLLERREIEAEYARFFNFSLDLLCITDNYGSFININPAWKKTLGYTLQELIAKSLIDFVHPEDREKAFYFIQNGNSESFEVRFLCKNGDYKWLLWTFTHIKEKNLIYAVVHDVTQRKANENSLRKSKEEVTNILESITDGFFAIDKKWNFTYVNQAAEEILQRPKEELLEKNIWQEYPAAVGTFDVMYEQAIREQKPVRFTEYYPAPLDKWLEVQAFPSKSGISIYFRDVTERRNAIDRNVRSEAQFKAVFSSSLDGMLIVDSEGKCLDANPAASELFGISDKEMSGIDIKNYLAVDNNISFSREWQSFLEHKIQRSEYRLMRSDGSRVIVEFASPTTFLPGKHLIVLRDITQRKTTEEKLIQSRKLLAEAQSLVHLGSWEWNTQTGITWSDEVYKILGLNSKQFSPTLSSMRKLMFQEDRSNFYSQFGKKFQDGEEIEFTHRALLLDQTVKTLRQRVKISVDKQGVPSSFFGTVQDITESQEKEDALRQAEARYRTLVESLPGIVYLVQPHSPYSLLYVSPNINILGFSPEDWNAQPDLWKRMIHEEDRDHVVESIKNSIEQGTDSEFEYRITTTAGVTLWLKNKGRLILDENGNKIGWQGLMIDVTETKRLEAQLAQAQRLESIGRLAGGIAHDFNNMLMTINGYCELSLRMIEEDDELLRSNIEEIKKASERSALLTHQLLAFSRQQVLQLKVLDLNEVIDDISRMIERLVGERIKLNIIQEPKLKNVRADLGQLTQIIMNLAVNARDAMPDGGTLTIQTSNIYLSEEFATQHQPIQPGNYVALTIKDTGIGIDEETLKYIFEPFYTTKELGKGIGLGLATVYGIIKQLDGYIWVESNPGEGTTFNVYLSQIHEEPSEIYFEEVSDYELDGSETILLAEDEDMVRALTSQILEEYGYTVIEARDGAEALDLYKHSNKNIDLLMTDVVMPNMDGRELAERILKDNPQIRILFTSGYTDDEVIRHQVIATNANFIQKPFTFDELAWKIREILSDENERLLN